MNDVNIQKNISKGTNKEIYIEILRILAAISVIFNHTGEKGMFIFTIQEVGTLRFFIDMMISILITFNIPLFFMISGAFLDKYYEISIKKLLYKILRIVIIIILSSLLFYIYNKGYQKNSVIVFLKTLYTSRVSWHLWFLYRYLAFLICLPILSRFVIDLNDDHYKYIFLIALIFGFVKFFEFVLFNSNSIAINSNIKPSWLLTSTIFFPLLGYYCYNKLNITNKLLVCFTGLTIICLIITSYMTYVNGIRIGEWSEQKSETFHKLFNYVYAVNIFIFIKKIFEHRKVNVRVEKIITSISETTLGVYIIHPIVLEYVLKMIDRITSYNSIIIGFIISIISFIISSIIIYCLRLIPIVKKIL